MNPPLDLCAPMSAVLRRIALEVAAVADEFARIETTMDAGERQACANLQRFDSMVQRLRAIEAFIALIAPGAYGEVRLSEALEEVPLEAVRARLAGEQAGAHSANVDVEFW